MTRGIGAQTNAIPHLGDPATGSDSVEWAWTVESLQLPRYHQLYDFSAQISSNSANDLCFSPDGTKLFLLRSTGTLYRYDLSTAWDISTATYVHATSVAGTTPSCVDFSPDGTKFFIISHNDFIWRHYTCSTAWDLTTASAGATVTKHNCQSARFANAGTKLVVGDSSATGTIGQYPLSTAYDVSSAGTAEHTTGTLGDYRGMGGYDPTGTKLFGLNYNDDNIDQFSLSTAFDLSTINTTPVHEFTTARTSPVIGSPTGLFISPDGLNAYVTCAAIYNLFQFKIGQTISPPS
jgi:WD40 repeat protein